MPGAEERYVTAQTLPGIVAIDGPAASGKSSLGAALAARLGYLLFDTGVTYRAFTVVALERDVPASDPAACEELALSLHVEIFGMEETHIAIDGVDLTDRLRDADVEANVSAYSAVPGVRKVMVAKQRAIAEQGRAVVVGRDIGTIVLPDAPVKLYLEASAEARARRRSAQAKEWGTAQDEDGARQDILGRDAIDSSRQTSPLRPAEDAVIIETTHLTPHEVLERAWEAIQCARD